MGLTPRAWILGALFFIPGCQQAIPRALPPSEIPGQIRKLTGRLELGFAGLAFWRGKLYATTNIGLLEIQEDRPTGLYQRHDDYNVVEGPWIEEGGSALWLWEFPSLNLLRWNGTEWTVSDLPPKERGVHTRGDVLAGFRMCSSDTRFWLEGAGSAWQWDRPAARWIPQRLPNDGGAMLAPVGEHLFAVARGPRASEDESPRLEVHVFDGTQWERVADAPWEDRIATVVGTSAAGYLLTAKGEVARFDRRGLHLLTPPGRCEALARTSEGHLLASFGSKGIFEYRGDAWTLRCAYPYGPGERKHLAFLAEDRGRIAFATTATSRGAGTTALWVLKGESLRRISLDEE